MSRLFFHRSSTSSRARLKRMNLIIIEAVCAAVCAFSLEAGAAELTRSDQDRLKSAVMEAQSQLGNLEPWQKKIFSEEVVSSYSKFIKDYRQLDTGLKVVVDVEGIKKYLEFYAPLFVQERNAKHEIQIFYEINSDPSCEKCSGEVASLKGLLKAFLERRGFSVIDKETPEVSKSKKPPKPVPMGEFILQMKPMVSDPSDTAHADEKHFQISLSYKLQVSASQTLKNEGKLEILEDDRFEDAAIRLLGSVFTDLASQVGPIRFASSEGKDVGEIFLELKGIHDYIHLTRVKTQIQNEILNGLKTPCTLEEKKISRGLILFKLNSLGVQKGFLEALKKELSGKAVELGRLSVGEIENQTLHLEIQ